MKVSSQNLLKNVDKILEEEGNLREIKPKSPIEILEELIMPAMEISKDTLSSLYSYEPPTKVGIIGKLKNKVLFRLRNIIFNVVEKQSMRQQKHNELVYKAIQQLIEENKSLKAAKK